MAQLPNPEHYSRDMENGVQVCHSCRRPVDQINGLVGKHIMGCAFRSLYEAIAMYNLEQSRKRSILDLDL